MVGDTDEPDSGFETVPDSPAVANRSMEIAGGVGDQAATTVASATASRPTPTVATTTSTTTTTIATKAAAGSSSKQSRSALEYTLDDEEDDETLAERLWGLTEMFPERVRNATSSLASVTQSAVTSIYGVSRGIIWVFFSSAAILAAPVMFEVERIEVDQVARQQQREILLGPSAAMANK